MTKFLLLLAIGYQAIVHGFDPRIIYAQVFVESSFNPQARCGNCVGLMQINGPIWKKALNLDPERMTEVMYNLDKGLTILGIYYKQTGEIFAALHRYNNGPSGKHNNGNYVKKIKKIVGRENEFKGYDIFDR